MTPNNTQLEQILNSLVSVPYIVDNNSAYTSQYLITPERLAKAQADIEALIAEAVREARIELIQSQIDFNYSIDENLERLKLLEAQLQARGEKKK